MRVGTRITSLGQRSRRRRGNRRILVGGLLVLSAIWGLPHLVAPLSRLLGRTPLFQAERVEVTGLLYLSRQEIRSAIPVREGQSLFTVRPGEIVRSLEKNPRIESARVTFAASAVRVSVRERRPFVLLHVGTLVEVDSAGTILQPLARGLIADRPVVEGLSVPTRRPGSRIQSPRFAEIRELVLALESPEIGLLSEISEIIATDPRWVVLRTSRDEIPILIDPERITPRCLKALAVTLHDLREHDRRVLAVDARYRGQVIVRCAPETLGPEPAQRDKV